MVIAMSKVRTIGLLFYVYGLRLKLLVVLEVAFQPHLISAGVDRFSGGKLRRQEPPLNGAINEMALTFEDL
ncbi:hypothetical protein TNCV_3911301 [Trichonephila clavipes]|nr:hypothetical protein TNCV_3911301 [Trichonephila clavipes]